MAVPDRMPIAEKLDHWFKYHPPGPAAVERHAAVRAAGLAFAKALAVNCPDSADLTVAVRCVREAVMWANAAIACDGK